MAVASFIVGIIAISISLCIFTYPASIILGILAIIFGIVGVSRDKENKKKAIVGIVLGLITLIICSILGKVMYEIVRYVIDNLPKIQEEILEYFDNEKENMINDIIRQLDNKLPF